MTPLISPIPKEVLLIGAGPMAVEYAKVLRELGVAPIVVGRSTTSAAAFREQTGLAVATGGLSSWLDKRPSGPMPPAIVAVGEKWIGATARQLMDAGVRHLLLEKPGGYDAQDIVRTHEAAQACGAKVYVGYNRRFYASVAAARDIIRVDGGVLSFHFEFTEWSHVIAGLVKEDGVKEQWFLSNSTHVIDLAFHLGGWPEQWATFTAGGLPWHPGASVFSGAGVSQNKALFSYQANWGGPGRWSIEMLTSRSRLIFRPMEKLQIQKIGSVAIEPVPIDDSLDQRFKPGLHAQLGAFFGHPDSELLPTLQDQVTALPYFLRMRGDPQR